MNHEKAREFFSAYYEETLEAGLRQVLEQRLQADPKLMAEYRAFARTVEELANLRLEEIEPPVYLSDRIATRLEQLQEQKRRSPWARRWFPGLAVGAIAATAIFGAIMTLNASSGDPHVVSGNIIPNVPGSKPQIQTKDQLSFFIRKGVVVAAFHPTTPRSTTITEVKTGKVVEHSNGFEDTFENANPDPVLFSVKVSGGGPQSFVVIPGGSQGTASAGSGTVQEFAIALAARYTLPVVVRTADATKRITWTLDASDGQAAAQKALEGIGYRVELRPGNLLVVSEH